MSQPFTSMSVFPHFTLNLSNLNTLPKPQTLWDFTWPFIRHFFNPLISLMSLLWTVSNFSTTFLTCTNPNWTPYSSSSQTCTKYGGNIISPLLFDMPIYTSMDCISPFSHRVALGAHVLLIIHLDPQVFFAQSPYFPGERSPFCKCGLHTLFLEIGLCIWLYLNTLFACT